MSASAAKAIKKVGVTHDTIIDLILTYPGISQGEIARIVGYTEAWISRIVNSDVFIDRCTERRVAHAANMSTPLRDKLEFLAHKGLDRIHRKLDADVANITPLEDLHKITTDTLERLGYGVRGGAGDAQPSVQVNVVSAELLQEARKLVGQQTQPRPCIDHDEAESVQTPLGHTANPGSEIHHNSPAVYTDSEIKPRTSEGD